MLLITRNFIVATLLSTLSCVGFATDRVNDFNIAGFATFAYGKVLSDREEGYLRPELGNEGEYRDLNKFGLRFNKDLDNDLSITAQVVARGENDYKPEFDWIYASYHITPSLSVDVGRYRAPLYLYSDVLDVSYAYPWISPPVSVYNRQETPFNSLEGAMLNYQVEVNGWTSEFKFWYGNADDELTIQGLNTRLKLDDVYGLAYESTYSWLTLRAFYFDAISSADITSTVDPNFQALLGGLAALEGGLQMVDSSIEFMDSILWEDDHGQYYGIGFQLDFERFFIISEATQIDVEDNIVANDITSAYITAGVRFTHNWSVSITYSRDNDDVDEGLWLQLENYKGNGFDTELDQSIAGVEAAAMDLQEFDMRQYSLSTRWDFHQNAAFKAEYIYQENSYPDPSSPQHPYGFLIGLDLIF